MSKFLPVAQTIARLSKDTTQVGAIILGPDNEGGPWGYNGAPRGSMADEDERKSRPEKYWWMEHAERNAIYAAARTGFATKGCTIVVTHLPCMDCARAIVQAGIVKVVASTGELSGKWDEHGERVERLFAETGVEFRKVGG